MFRFWSARAFVWLLAAGLSLAVLIIASAESLRLIARLLYPGAGV